MNHLHRNISALQLFGITFGCTIGSGWLFAPYYTAKYAGSYALWAWLLGAIVMTSIILCFLELVVLYPEPGSMARFGKRSHGPLVGSVYGLFLWLGMVSIPPIETTAILQYAANAWPSLGQQITGGFALSHLGIAVAALILLLMVILNIIAIQWFAKISNLLVLIKVFLPLLLIVVLLITAFHWSNFTVHIGNNTPVLETIMEALPLGGVIFAYTGFSNALQLAGEVKKPQKALPFALLGTCLCTSLFYILLQTSFIGAFNPNQLAQGWNNIVMEVDKGPFLALLEQLKVNWFIPFIAFASCLSPFVAGLIDFSGSARTLFALSEDKVLPQQLTIINKQGIPVYAVLVNFFLGLGLLLPLRGWHKLVGLLVSFIAFVYSIGPIALGTLRLTHPEIKRSFRLKSPHIIAIIAFIFSNRIIFWTGANTVYLLSTLVIIFYGWYLVFKTEKTERMLEFSSSWWLLIYTLGLSSLAYFGNFGGDSYFTYREECLAISLLSIIIYTLALFCGKKRYNSFRIYRKAKI